MLFGNFQTTNVERYLVYLLVFKSAWTANEQVIFKRT